MTLLLRKFWPHILAAILIATLLAVVNGWRKDSNALDDARQELKDFKERVATSEKTKKDVDDAHTAELEKLRAAARNQPIPVVRLCKPAPVVPDYRPSVVDNGPAPASGSVPANDGLHSEEQGPDIGRPLYGTGDRADLLSAQVRALQDYIHKLQKQ